MRFLDIPTHIVFAVRESEMNARHVFFTPDSYHEQVKIGRRSNQNRQLLAKLTAGKELLPGLSHVNAHHLNEKMDSAFKIMSEWSRWREALYL